MQYIHTLKINRKYSYFWDNVFFFFFKHSLKSYIIRNIGNTAAQRRPEWTSRNPNEFNSIKCNGVVNLTIPSAVERWDTIGIPHLIYIADKNVLGDLYGDWIPRDKTKFLVCSHPGNIYICRALYKNYCKLAFLWKTLPLYSNITH